MPSSAFDIIEFEQFLKKISLVSREELENLLRVFEINGSDDSVKCEFYLMRCEAQDIREDDFVQFMYDNIINYTLSYADRHPPKGKKMTKEQIVQYYCKTAARMTSKAEGSFIKKYEHSGELGELFLFIVLESKGIIQLLNKMSLKTSPEMPVHGLDAIHIGVDKNRHIILCYGYSKMHKRFPEALNSAVDEIEDFSKDKNREEFEFSIASSRMDDERFDKYSEEIKKLLSPYARHKENLARAHSIFLGYEWDVLKSQNLPKSCDIEKYLIPKYQVTHTECGDRIRKKVLSLSDAPKRTFLVLILPFADLDEVRSKFRKKIHAPNSTGPETDG